jgi:hypothetical protein
VLTAATFALEMQQMHNYRGNTNQNSVSGMLESPDVAKKAISLLPLLWRTQKMFADFIHTEATLPS